MTSRSILRCDSEYSVLYPLGLITEAFLYPNLDYKIIVMVTWTINAMNAMNAMNAIDQIGGYLTRLAVEV